MEREILTAQMPGNQSRAIMKKITPFLWFDKQAEEAAKFYTTVFKGSKILGIARYTKGTPGKPGSVLSTLEAGQDDGEDTDEEYPIESACPAD